MKTIQVYVLVDDDGNIHMDEQFDGSMRPAISTSRTTLEEENYDTIQDIGYSIKEGVLSLQF